ncbi:hypothetical protein HGRIS_005715 [Hohenbuehelia grisea]|uniref:Uncharacterized protein n=1 Tax=Hohenbuehelia grisea TaxID=104357 RepID=A0ABR3JZY5_9AGAR
MAGKRRNDDTDQTPEVVTGRTKKKVRLQVARTIAVQPVASGSSQIAAAGPSNTSTSKRLPGSLDVEKFVEARSFEIEAMHKAMKTASASSTQRAWQALPRHLRRRAASHDVRRVPLRLRDKARAEMDPVSKKASTRVKPQRGKDKRETRTESFVRRQKEKTWLETHIWHAKRMHMENMWGYRLAVQPTEKSFRPSHRASVHGSILHDASYMSLIELKGPQNVLELILKYCCDPQGAGPGTKRFVAGSRVNDTRIYTPDMFPHGLIAPASILWRPDSAPPSSGNSTQQQKASTAKGKQKATTPIPRVVWIRCHPASYDAIIGVLQQCTSRVMKVAGGNVGTPETEVEIADLRGEVNMFEIMGPKANQVIKGAFTPSSACKNEDFNKLWLALGNLQSTGSLPRGMVIGFTVNDPRLKFPPKNAKPELLDPTHLVPPVPVFPSSALAQSSLWDDTVRAPLKTPMYKKKDIDRRKSQNLVPGTPLTPLRQDNRIPVLLIQRSLEAASSAGVSQRQPSEALHGWTLLFPSGWGMPFLSALTHTGTRIGGQRERATQTFEAGTLFYPRDFPGTTLFETEEAQREAEEKARWERTPKAKRVNYEKLGTRSAWRADWEVVLGLEKREEKAGGEELVSTQREKDEMQVEEVPEVEDEAIIATTKATAPASGPTQSPWLLRGPLLARMVALPNPAATLLEEVNKLRQHHGDKPFDVGHGRVLSRSALVSVRLRMCGRGVMRDLAVIYAMQDEEVVQWQEALKTKGSDGEHDNEVGLRRMQPSSACSCFLAALRQGSSARLNHWVHHGWKLFSVERRRLQHRCRFCSAILPALETSMQA